MSGNISYLHEFEQSRICVQYVLAEFVFTSLPQIAYVNFIKNLLKQNHEN